MRAASADSQGAAAEVLRVGEPPEPTAGPGEVRVRLRHSGINPGSARRSCTWTPDRRWRIPGDPAQRRVRGRRPGRPRGRSGVGSANGSGSTTRSCTEPSVRRRSTPPYRMPVRCRCRTGSTICSAPGLGIWDHRYGLVRGRTRPWPGLVDGSAGRGRFFRPPARPWGGATAIGTVRRASDLEELSNPDRRACGGFGRPRRRRRRSEPVRPWRR